jgi:hypothetical protein|tara:strand:- start:45 stop:194 length:150 start_codon:yes stop_codon:yes gene_type:complete
MKLNDVELAMLVDALKSVSFVDGLKPSIDQIRLQRKLIRWADHPDLEFT